LARVMATSPEEVFGLRRTPRPSLRALRLVELEMVLIFDPVSVEEATLAAMPRDAAVEPLISATERLPAVLPEVSLRMILPSPRLA